MAHPTSNEIFVVDDDACVCEALTLLLELEGYRCRTFRDGIAFLEAVDSATPICVVLDVQMPGPSGLDILRTLTARRFLPPVFMMSGRSDIALAVEAMKMGACDFVEKPFSARVLVERVRKAITSVAWLGQELIEGVPQFEAMRCLTAREREVLSQIARGASNKEAGRGLGISPRTIEVHRARIMDKLGARNTADLMRIVLMNGRAATSYVAPRECTLQPD